MKKLLPPKGGAKTPVTVITGYLGAGKTTLLRRLLDYAQKRGVRLAVVMNEFGEVGIDGKLVKGKNVELVELSGGCVCCSMSGEFEAALKELVAKAKPDQIVIETTGVAEPDAIVVDLGSMEGVRLDAIVTIADGDSLARYATLGNTGRVQLKMADLVLLNKSDLVGKRELEQVREGIRELNKRAAIIECVKCGVDPEIVLAVNAAAKSLPRRGHDHSQNEFFVFEASALDAKKFAQFAKSLPAQIYRAKGFVKLVEKAGKPKTFLWNFVAGRSELEPWAGKESGQLVFIGENAGKAESRVRTGLQKCELKGNNAG